MKLLVGLGILGMMTAAIPAYAQSTAVEPEGAQLLCDLTGDCGDATAPETGQPAAQSGKGKPRSSATRGFTFNRATTQAPATGTQTAVATPKLVKPTTVGASDMGLTFLTGSAVLTEPARMRLAKYAVALNNNKLAGRRLRIEGHTDASGSAKANMDLSRRRAQAVADFLVTTGIPRARLEVVGRGSTSPLPGQSATAAANRRVMAVLL